MNVMEKAWEDVDLMNLAQVGDQRRAVLNTVMNLRVQYKTGNFLTMRVSTRLSRRTLLHGII